MECKFSSKCTNPKCKFIHPKNTVQQKTQLCKFNSNCANPSCPYFHPAGVSKPQTINPKPIDTSCRFSLHCTNPQCKYVHPCDQIPKPEVPICKFYPECSNKECKYRHLDNLEFVDFTVSDVPSAVLEELKKEIPLFSKLNHCKVEVTGTSIKVSTNYTTNITALHDRFAEIREQAAKRVQTYLKEMVICGTTRALIGSGGQTEAIITGDEYVSLTLSNIPTKCTSSLLINTFSKYGAIRNVLLNTDNALIRFSKPSEANAAYWDCKTQKGISITGLRDSKITAKPYISSAVASKSSSPEILKITLCSHHSGSCTILFSEEIARTNALLALNGSTHPILKNIYGTPLAASIPATNTTANSFPLILKNIASRITEREIKQTCSQYGKIQQVDFLHSKNWNVDTKLLKSSLKTILKSKGSLKSLSPVILSPGNVIAKTQAICKSVQDAELIQQAFQDKDITIVGQLARLVVTQDKNIYIPIPLEMYKRLEKDIQEYTYSMNQKYPFITIKIDQTRQQEHHSVLMKIKTKDSKASDELSKCKLEYDRLFGVGKQIKLNDVPGVDLKFLFEKGSPQSMAKQISDQLGPVYINLDKRRLYITVHGKDEKVIQKAREEMEHKIIDFCEKYNHSWTKTLSKQAWKHLVSVFGSKFEKLYQNVEDVMSVFYSHQNLELSVKGSKEALHKTAELVESLLQNVKEENKTLVQTNSEECTCCICFSSEVECNESFINLLCHHKICKPCMEYSISAALENKLLFPIRCGACSTPFSVRDIFNNLAESDRDKFAQMSVSKFLDEASNGFCYCFCKTGCSQILSTKNKIAYCDRCASKYCTSCKVEYHEGLTCTSYYNLHGLSAEERQELKNSGIFMCPKCGARVIKDDGCNSVCCDLCKTHFCWKCFQVFKNSADTHKHLLQAHGGYW